MKKLMFVLFVALSATTYGKTAGTLVRSDDVALTAEVVKNGTNYGPVSIIITNGDYTITIPGAGYFSITNGVGTLTFGSGALNLGGTALIGVADPFPGFEADYVGDVEYNDKRYLLTGSSTNQTLLDAALVAQSNALVDVIAEYAIDTNSLVAKDVRLSDIIWSDQALPIGYASTATSNVVLNGSTMSFRLVDMPLGYNLALTSNMYLWVQSGAATGIYGDWTMDDTNPTNVLFTFSERMDGAMATTNLAAMGSNIAWGQRLWHIEVNGNHSCVIADFDSFYASSSSYYLAASKKYYFSTASTTATESLAEIINVPSSPGAQDPWPYIVRTDLYNYDVYMFGKFVHPSDNASTKLNYPLVRGKIQTTYGHTITELF